MSPPAVNIHGTAIVIGTCGLLFVGPSGSDKSSLAFSCLAQARRDGLFSALISDDQVFVSLQSGRIVAHAPESITGLIELRGSGIVETETLTPALLHYAVLPVDLRSSERLPPQGEHFELFEGALLPLLRIAATVPDPLAVLSAFVAFNGKPLFEGDSSPFLRRF